MLLCSTDHCVFILKNLIVLVHVDDCLIFSQRKLWIDLSIKSLFEGQEKFELMDKGDTDEYLGVDTKKNKDNFSETRQHFLTKRIIEQLKLEEVETQKRTTPVKQSCDTIDLQLEAFCKVFEENKNCIAVAESKKPPTRTKHTEIKCYHFRKLVSKKTTRINCTDAEEQLADSLIKPMEDNQFF